MIIDAIFTMFQNLAMWLVEILPETSISFGDNGLGAYLGNANQFINMPLLMTFVGAFVAYEVAVLTARLVYWIWMTLKP